MTTQPKTMQQKLTALGVPAVVLAKCVRVADEKKVNKLLAKYGEVK